MAHYRLPLTAGEPARQIFSGKCVLLPDLGAADQVSLTLLVGTTQTPAPIGDVQRNFTSYSPSVTFTGAEFVSTIDTVIDVVVTDFELRTMNGNEVTAVIDAAQLPLAVQNGQGDVPGNPVFVSGVTLSDTPAASAANNGAVAVTSAGAVVLAADPTRLVARFRNIGNDPVAIGPAGLTWAQRALVLGPDDMWEEQKGAALAWSAITDAGATASVTVLELMA